MTPRRDGLHSQGVDAGDALVNRWVQGGRVLLLRLEGISVLRRGAGGKVVRVPEARAPMAKIGADDEDILRVGEVRGE